MALWMPHRFPTVDSSCQPRPQARSVPALALVTEEELRGTPQYMRSRLDIAKVNAALQVSPAYPILKLHFVSPACPLAPSLPPCLISRSCIPARPIPAK